MLVKIVRKFAQGEDGLFLPADKVPEKVLLETDHRIDKEGKLVPSGNPAIKVGNRIFYFGKPHDTVENFRVLALWTNVVCVQE